MNQIKMTSNLGTPTKKKHNVLPLRHHVHILCMVRLQLSNQGYYFSLRDINLI
jgi:hypothetical protein